MKEGQASYRENTSINGWRVDLWGLFRGLIILSSAVLTITILHYVILALFRG